VAQEGEAFAAKRAARLAKGKRRASTPRVRCEKALSLEEKWKPQVG